jgi:thioredoxin-related protein
MKSLRTIIAGLMAVFLQMHAVQAEDEVQLEGAELGHWTMDYDAAVQLAAEKKVPMLINFTGSDWCGWCKLMDGSVFGEEEWKTFATENTVLITVDFPKDKSIVPEKYVDRNKALKEKFGVKGYPTYVILDSDGETVIGQLGAGRDKTPASFIEEYEGVVRMSEASIAAYIEEHPDKAESYTKAIEEVRASEKGLSDWIETRPERNEENSKKFEAFQKSIVEAQAKLAEF